MMMDEYMGLIQGSLIKRKMDWHKDYNTNIIKHKRWGEIEKCMFVS